MRKALKNTPVSDFLAPEGLITSIAICSETGQLATPFCPDVRYESFIAGNEPTENCELHGNSFEGEHNNFNQDTSPENTYPDADNYVQPPLPGIIQQPKPAPPPQVAPQHKRRVLVKICTESGLIASPNCPDSVIVSEVFVEGEEPKMHCNIHNHN